MSKEIFKRHRISEIWKYVQNSYYFGIPAGRYPSGTRRDWSYISTFFPFIQGAKQSIFTHSTEAKIPHTSRIKFGSLGTIFLAIYYPSWQFYPLNCIKKSVLLLNLLLRYEMNYTNLRVSYIRFNILWHFIQTTMFLSLIL